MSFILDALKKSDRKRQRAGVPDLQTSHAPSPPARRKRPLWPWLLVAALLLNAGLAAWWLASSPGPDSVAKDVRQEAPAAAAAPEEPEARPAPAPQAATPVAEKASPPLREAPAAASVKQRPVKAQASEAPAVSQVAPKQAPVVEPAAEPTPPPAAAPVVAEPRTYELDELPASVRAGIPEMTMSVHFYTPRTGSRMVRINNQILREGDTFFEGMILEEITPEGVIFGYQGYRFRMLNLSTGRAGY